MNDYINNAFTREGENTNLEINNLNVGCITSKNNKFELDSSGNLTVKSITAQTVNSMAITNAIYPVGSIYLSVNNTNPSILFGGEWEQIRDKFLLGCGDDYQAGSTGGEATHKLTVNEMPSHQHNLSLAIEGSNVSNKDRVALNGYGNSRWWGNLYKMDSTGGSQAHNNMPPYLAVYMWKRVS